MDRFFSDRFLRPFFLVLSAILFVVHFGYIYSFALDVPFFDTWYLFEPGHLKDNFDFSWSIHFHNEHRIFVTRVVAWILYKINGLNLVHMGVIHYGFFGALLLALFFLLREEFKLKHSWLIAFGYCLTLSPLNYQNHLLPFNIHFHSSILFSLLFLQCIYHDNLTWRRVILGAFLSALAIFSMSSGLLEVALALVVLLVSFYWDLRGKKEDSRSSIAKIATITAYCSLLIALYFAGYSKPSSHPSLAMPYEFSFWRFYRELISLGFGFRDVSVLFSGLAFFVAHFPPIYLFFKTSGLKTATTQERKLFATWCGLAVVLMGVAAGRAGFGLLQAKDSRYSEWGLISIPVTLGLWLFFLNTSKLKKGAQNAIVVLLFLFYSGAFWDEWSFVGPYANWQNHVLRGQDFIVKYYADPPLKDGEQVITPFIASGDRKLQLDYAKKMNFSYYRTAMDRVRIEGSRIKFH